MVVAAYGLILPQAVLDLPRAGLPQHPCLAAAEVARGCADRARDPGWRPRNRRLHHEDGSRPRHRSGGHPPRHSHRAGRHRRQLARPAGGAGRRSDRRGFACIACCDPAKWAPTSSCISCRSRRRASPTRARSRRPRRASTGGSTPTRSPATSGPSTRIRARARRWRGSLTRPSGCSRRASFLRLPADPAVGEAAPRPGEVLAVDRRRDTDRRGQGRRRRRPASAGRRSTPRGG